MMRWTFACASICITLAAFLSAVRTGPPPLLTSSGGKLCNVLRTPSRPSRRTKLVAIADSISAAHAIFAAAGGIRLDRLDVEVTAVPDDAHGRQQAGEPAEIDPRRCLRSLRIRLALLAARAGQYLGRVVAERSIGIEVERLPAMAGR